MHIIKQNSKIIVFHKREFPQISPEVIGFYCFFGGLIAILFVVAIVKGIWESGTSTELTCVRTELQQIDCELKSFWGPFNHITTRIEGLQKVDVVKQITHGGDGRNTRYISYLYARNGRTSVIPQTAAAIADFINTPSEKSVRIRNDYTIIYLGIFLLVILYVFRPRPEPSSEKKVKPLIMIPISCIFDKSSDTLLITYQSNDRAHVRRETLKSVKQAVVVPRFADRCGPSLQLELNCGEAITIHSKDIYEDDREYDDVVKEINSFLEKGKA